MALLKAENLNFQYAGTDEMCLKDISFEIKEGEFILLFGETGCGKSTLLKQWKPSIRPEGMRTGKIIFDGISIEELEQQKEASCIGYVSQNPDNQIVTDKVWHELAFTLENMGCPSEEIRRRTAEISVFFGITSWFHKSTNELSGGQKQILNLASVMIAKPKLLLLDEPTSQLDPIATENFIYFLAKIHEEFGTTIVMTEHRLEEVYAKVDRCMVMEKGNLLCAATVEETVKYLYKKLNHKRKETAFSLLPLQARLPVLLGNRYSIRTIGEAKYFVDTECRGGRLDSQEISIQEKEIVCSFQNVWFRYEKEGNDVLRDFSIEIHKNDFVALVGANGQGKSTFLKAAVGIVKPYRGKITYNEKGRKKRDASLKIAMLPQNPQTLFLKNTVEEDLKMVNEDMEWVVEELKIREFLSKHPYDLSGGQQQMAALAKVLLTKPDLLFLDEPTKGVDQIRKKSLGALFQKLNEKGITIVLASHDVDFCAAYAKTVGMLFDGVMTSIGQSRRFFLEQYFYTTTCLKICRDKYEGMVVEKEVFEYEKIL